MKNLSLLGIILLLAFFGCRNDIDEMNGGSSTVEPPIIIQDYDPDSELVTGTVFGRVYDEQENPVVDALVQYDGQNYTTDEDGRFFITDETLDKQGTFLTVEADGFFKGSRRFNPQDSSVNYVYVQLLALNEIGTFEAANGAELNGDDGLGITFPPNSIQSASGALYSGQVSVAAKWLDPTADNIGEIMPGNLLGLNSQIEEVALVSYGMAAVELFGENGEKLNVAEGQTATLSFPVPQELLNTAPATIPLWSFEEEQFGIWVEDGGATLTNGRYVGEVSHFSFWNCDAPFELVFIQGQLLSENGAPLTNVAVNISIDGQPGGRYGYTDNRGFFSGKMPKGVDLILSVGYQGEECSFNTINLGSFEEDANVGGITLDELDAEFTISGSIFDCEGNPFTNGIVIIEVGTYSVNYLLNGNNSFNVGVFNCSNDSEVTISIFDLNNFTTSDEFDSAIIPEVNFGTITTCGSQETQFFNFNVNGESVINLNALLGYYEEQSTGLPYIQSGPFLDTFLDSTIYHDSHTFRLLFYNLNEGAYDKNNIDLLSIRTNLPDFSQSLTTFCLDTNCTKLTEFEMTIVENNTVDGFLSGNFNGVGVFMDLDSIAYTYPFNGNFRIPMQ